MIRLTGRARLAGYFALGVLLVINMGPLFLVLRQAFSPPGDATGWPLSLVPSVWSTENLRTLWTSQRLGYHLVLSTLVATASTAIAIGLGFPAGWGLARWRRAERAGLSCCAIARVVPPIAIAIPMVGLLIRAGLYNHPWGAGLVVTHVATLLPVAILVGYAAFREIPAELEEAAWVDGCSTLGGFWHVALPTSRSAIGAAAVLCFLMSWDEFTFAVLIQLTHRTLPPLIYYYASYGEMGSASALAAITLVPASLAVVLVLKGVGSGALSGSLKG